MKVLLDKLNHIFLLAKQDYPYLKVELFVNAFITAFLPFYNLYLSARMLNAILNHQFHDAVYVIVYLVGGILIGNLIRTITDSKLNIASSTIRNSVARQLNEKVYVMQYEKYDKQSVIEKLQALRQQENSAGGVGTIIDLTQKLLTAVFGLVFACLFVGQMFYHIRSLFVLSDPFFWGLIVSAVLFVLTGSYISQKGASYFRIMMQENIHDNTVGGYVINESARIDNKKDIMVYHMSDIILHYLQSMHHSFQHFLVYSKKDGILQTVLSIVMNLFGLMSYIFLGVHAVNGDIAIGNVLMYAGAIQRITTQMKDLVGTYNDLKYCLNYCDEYYAFIHDSSMNYDGTLPIEKRNDANYEFEFRNVSFKYPGTEIYALKNVSLKFNIGEKMAVVGKNGAGKTTLVKLLCRLYEPTEGEILLNGIDIRKYNYQEYTTIFAPVFQDFAIFSMSVAENITGSTEHMDKEKVMDALGRVGLKERILNLKDGINTLLNHDNGEGVSISGGEAQKLAIARALYKDAPFVILDEPTAALDPIAEAEIYEHFNELVRQKTSIYISHRMSSCKFCDRIIVFDQGRIVEEGNHNTLLKQDGIYASLYGAQAEYYK